MYDIDNKKIPTDKELTVEEARNLIEHYKELAENEESNHKRGVYNTYIKNLNSWLFKYYLNNPQIVEELIKNTDKDVINNAIEEISEELSNDTTTKERITEEIQRAIPKIMKVVQTKSLEMMYLENGMRAAYQREEQSPKVTFWDQENL